MNNFSSVPQADVKMKRKTLKKKFETAADHKAQTQKMLPTSQRTKTPRW